MEIVSSPKQVQETALGWRREGGVALVPTMGCLHRGHLDLVRRAREFAPKVIVSIFVNPLQFGPNEDFSKYPRTFDDDCRLLEATGADLVFHPEVSDLYPDPFRTRVAVSSLATHLCGASRPGHFEGVATVCLKLFEISQATVAVFGEKDFQQLRVIQQMVSDLNLPLEIVPHPTVREPDGLALSSRNQYLAPMEREKAIAIPQALSEAQVALLLDKERTAGELGQTARTRLEEAGFVVDYIQVAAAGDLAPLAANVKPSTVPSPRLFVAARLGTTRLIDNIALN